MAMRVSQKNSTRRTCIVDHFKVNAASFLVSLSLLSIYQLCYFCLEVRSETVFQPKPPTSSFHIVIVQPKIGEGYSRIAFGYITGTRLEEKELIKLGKKLRNQFVKDSKVNVFFFNNKEDAILYGKKLIDHPTKENLRVIYFKDKDKKEEYIEYFPDAPNSAKTKKLELRD